MKERSEQEILLKHDIVASMKTMSANGHATISYSILERNFPNEDAVSAVKRLSEVFRTKSKKKFSIIPGESGVIIQLQK